MATRGVGMLLLQSGACGHDGNGRRVANQREEVLDEFQAATVSPSSKHPCDANSGALDETGQWSRRKWISWFMARRRQRFGSTSPAYQLGCNRGTGAVIGYQRRILGRSGTPDCTKCEVARIFLDRIRNGAKRQPALTPFWYFRCLFVVAKQRHHVVVLQPVAAVEEREFDDESQAGDSGA